MVSFDWQTYYWGSKKNYQQGFSILWKNLTMIGNKENAMPPTLATFLIIFLSPVSAYLTAKVAFLRVLSLGILFGLLAYLVYMDYYQLHQTIEMELSWTGLIAALSVLIMNGIAALYVNNMVDSASFLTSLPNPLSHIIE